MKIKITIRKVIIFSILVVLILIARPVGFLIYNYYEDKKVSRLKKTGYINDASNLNETKIETVIKVAEGIEAATTQISELINLAKAQGKKISIAGAQHSMGGHTIYKDGIVLDMKTFHYLNFDSIQNILIVGSGALWAEVIPYLDKKKENLLL